MVSNYLVSVLLPVYNAADYLTKAIDSILNQTFTDFEFIIINDGSTDGSLKILEDYARQDARIRLVNRENKGLIKTLNEGLRLATGKYIARMDQDDISLPPRFERQVEYLRGHVECVAVGVLSQFIDFEGDLISPMGSLILHEEIDSAHMKGKGGAMVHPSVMIRRDAMIAVGGYSEKYPNAEDLDFWLRLAEYGKLANITERLFLYRQHLESIGYLQRLSQIDSAKKAVVDACFRRGIVIDQSLLCDVDEKIPSVSDVYIKWGWWALKGGNTLTARKYAKKAMLSSPFKCEAWKLLACSLRGY